jgi:AcrR family transcriptional regulator
MNTTKENILRTSLLLFLQKSYKEVTMKEIVEKTGLSKGAFYHHFKSKEELYKEIIKLFFASGTLNYHAFPKDSLYNFFMHYVSSMNNSINELNQLLTNDNNESSLNFFLIIFDAVSRFPEFLAIEHNLYLENIRAWEAIIQTAREKEEIATISSNTDIANLFLYCTDGVFLRYANSDKDENYETVLKRAFISIYDNIKN